MRPWSEKHPQRNGGPTVGDDFTENKTNTRSRLTIGDRVRAVVPTLLLDLVLPYGVYLVLFRLGVPLVIALTAGGCLPAVRAAVHWAKRRALDFVAIFVTVLFLLGAVVSLLAGDPRFAVARESIFTGVVGVICFASVFTGKPVMFYVRRQFSPYQEEDWEAFWTNSPSVRRNLRVVTLAWGLCLVMEAIVLVGVVYTLPVTTSASLAPLLNFGVIGLLVAFTHLYSFFTRKHLPRPTLGGEHSPR